MIPMRSAVIRQIMLVSLITSIAFSSGAQDSYQILNKDAVTDPKVTAAVNQIESKLREIKGYSCLEDLQAKTSAIPPNGNFPGAPASEIQSREERYYKSPNLYGFRKKMLKSPLPGMDGQLEYTKCDGTYIWKQFQNAPGSGQTLLNRLDPNRQLSEQQRQKILADHEKPQVTCTNFAQFKAAGLDPELIFITEKILQPFRFCDMSTLAIASENDTSWNFKSSLKEKKIFQDYSEVHVQVEKATGFIQKMGIINPEKKDSLNFWIKNVKINPEIDPAVFEYVNPPGIVFQDNTQEIIKALKQLD